MQCVMRGMHACSCAMDKDLQPKDPNRSAILGNIAGLITRELEKDWAAQQQKQQLQQQLRGPKQPKPVTMSQQAFMIVDVAAPGWRVLHMSRHALDRTGVVTHMQEWQTYAFVYIVGIYRCL